MPSAPGDMPEKSCAPVSPNTRPSQTVWEENGSKFAVWRLAGVSLLCVWVIGSLRSPMKYTGFDAKSGQAKAETMVKSPNLRDGVCAATIIRKYAVRALSGSQSPGKKRPNTVCSLTDGILPVNENYRHPKGGSGLEGDRRPAIGG